MKFKSSKAGFTLVEMLVAVGIFVIVAFIVTSVFITLANANRKAQSIRLVMDNLNFAIDSVALKMREATDYNCTPNANGDCNEVSFTTAEGKQITYYFEEEQLDNGESIGRIFTCPAAACNNGTPITTDQVDITNFIVKINRSPGPRALATLLIKGSAGTGRTQTIFNIQTSVAERNFSGTIETP